MTAKEKAPQTKKSDPAQESRELLVWGAIPSVVGGVGLIIDTFYIGAQTATNLPTFGPELGFERDLTGNIEAALANPLIVPMFVGGLVTLILLALSRFGRKLVATIGSIGLIVFGVVVLGYLIYSLTTPSLGIYSLVMVLLSICLFVAGITGLLARRVIVVR